MATYYWGGGAGTWNATTTTNWYSNVGRTTLAGSAPTSADNVIFDSASNATAYAVTIGTNAVCLDVTIAGPASGNVTITSGATAVINCYGSWTNAGSGVAFSTTSGAQIIFLATTTGKTITTNAITLGALLVTLNGDGGAWSLGSAFTSTAGVVITAGTFTTTASNYALTAGAISSNNTNVRSISLNASAVTLSNATSLSFATATNLTFNAGTSTLTANNASVTFNGGGQTFYNVSFTGVTALTHTINGANTFNNLTFTSRTTDGVGAIVVSANQTINGTLTIGAANTAVRRLCVRSSTVGTQYTLTAATIATLADVDFQDTVAAGASGTWSGTRLGNCTNNSNITFSAGKTVYWNLASARSWSAVGWAATTGTAPAVNNFPLAQDTAVFDDTGSVTGIITINAGWNIGTLNITKTGAMTLASGTQTPRFFSNVTLQSATVTTGTGAWTYAAYGVSSTFTSNGATFTPPLTINALAGTLTLGNAFTTASATSLTAGTLTTNGNAITAGFFLSNNSNTRVLNLGASTVTISGTGTFWDITTSTGMTLNAGTSSLLFTGNSAVITFAGGGLTYYNVTFGATFYNTTITGVNTFNNFTVTSPPSAGRRLVSLSNNNQVINGTFSSVGSAANQRILYGGGNSGTTGQITAAAISIADTDFTSIIAAGPATPWNGTRIGNSGTGSSNITFATARTVYWNKPAGGNWSDNAWSLSSGGGVSIDNFPLGQDTVILNNTGVGAVSTIVMDYGWNVGSLNAGSLSNALTMNWNTFDSRVCGFNGNVTLSSAITLTATQGATSFDAGTITTAGVVFQMTVTFNTVSGTMILADNFTCTGAYAGLASGTLDLNGKTLSCLTFDSTFTDLQPRQIAFNGGQINVTGNAKTVWACENLTNFSYTGTPTVNFTYSGSTGTRTINHGGTAGGTEANAVDFNIVAGSDVVNTPASSVPVVRNLNFTGFSGLSGLFGGGFIYGNLTLSVTQTVSAASFITTFAATSGTKTITTNGVVIDRQLLFNGIGGTWALQDALTLGATNGSIRQWAGTFTTNNYSITCTDYKAQASTAVGNRSINLGSSVITLLGSATTNASWQTEDGSYTLTINAGTSTIYMAEAYTGTSSQLFYGGGKTYYNVVYSGGQPGGFYQGGTFNSISNSIQPLALSFEAGTTVTVNNFGFSGTAGNLVTMTSSVPGTQWNLAKNTGSKVLVSYCTISDSNITPTGYWFAPTNQGNVNGGNNTGWNFSANGLENNFFLMF